MEGRTIYTPCSHNDNRNTVTSKICKRPTDDQKKFKFQCKKCAHSKKKGRERESMYRLDSVIRQLNMHHDVDQPVIHHISDGAEESKMNLRSYAGR